MVYPPSHRLLYLSTFHPACSNIQYIRYIQYKRIYLSVIIYSHFWILFMRLRSALSTVILVHLFSDEIVFIALLYIHAPPMHNMDSASFLVFRTISLPFLVPFQMVFKIHCVPFLVLLISDVPCVLPLHSLCPGLISPGVFLLIQKPYLPLPKYYIPTSRFAPKPILVHLFSLYFWQFCMFTVFYYFYLNIPFVFPLSSYDMFLCSYFPPDDTGQHYVPKLYICTSEFLLSVTIVLNNVQYLYVCYLTPPFFWRHFVSSW
jgi:hypothetical protein